MCQACAPGSFAANEGQSSCGLCAAGQYQDQAGAAACFACPSGFTSTVGSMQCTAIVPAVQKLFARIECVSPDLADPMKSLVHFGYENLYDATTPLVIPYGINNNAILINGVDAGPTSGRDHLVRARHPHQRVRGALHAGQRQRAMGAAGSVDDSAVLLHRAGDAAALQRRGRDGSRGTEGRQG